MKRWSLDTLAKALGGGVRQTVRDFEMLQALYRGTDDQATREAAQDWGFAPRRFSELTNGELHMLAVGLRKDRMSWGPSWSVGLQMTTKELDRSVRLQDEMEDELRRREEEAE